MAEIGIGIIGGGYMGKAHAVAMAAVGAVFDTALRPRLEMVCAQTATWTEQRGNDGVSKFDIDHESSLKEMVWLLPKSRFAEMPVSKGGSVTVSDMGANWAVRAGNTRRASFTAVNAVNRL